MPRLTYNLGHGLVLTGFRETRPGVLFRNVV